MNQDPSRLFSKSKQDRSQKTLEEIMQAAEYIVAQANPELFNSRVLSKKSGYALGTLVRRLNSIENVFLWAIKNGRDKKFQEVAIAIANFDEYSHIEYFAENMIDVAFSGIKKVNPAVMRFFENRFTKLNGLPLDYFAYLDFLAEPYLQSSSKNKTNTFRQLTKNEAVLLLRQICLLVERPFIEGNPIAGTEEHRKIAIETTIRLLGR